MLRRNIIITKKFEDNFDRISNIDYYFKLVLFDLCSINGEILND